MAIAAVRDLDDISLHYLATRATPPSVRDHDHETTLITKDVTIHILTVIKSLFEKFVGYEKRESSSTVWTVGARTPTTRSTFGSHSGRAK